MEKKSKEAMDQMDRMARSPAGKALYAQLKRKDPAAFHKAMEQAAAGDYGAIQSTLSQLLQDPQIRQLLKDLGG